MNNSNTFLLESKLKRLKISYSNKNGKIIIAQSKIDYTVLLGLIFFPLFIGIATLIFFLISSPELREAHNGKIFGVIIFLFSIGIVNIGRMLTKIKANKTSKILGYKEINVKTKETSQRFDSQNIKNFEYTMKQLDKEIYHGSLFLVDTENQKHLILGFDGENEQYLSDDLQWFSDYFEKHVQLTA